MANSQWRIAHPQSPVAAASVPVPSPVCSVPSLAPRPSPPFLPSWSSRFAGDPHHVCCRCCWGRFHLVRAKFHEPFATGSSGRRSLLVGKAGLLFADRQLTEKGADWRPSVMVAFDDFERSRGWHRPDKDNDWYGKYAARQVRDLLGTIQGAGGAFLLKVKYVPEQQVIKIISIGRPAPNSPSFVASSPTNPCLPIGFG
jgi:hypothetical protein